METTSQKATEKYSNVEGESLIESNIKKSSAALVTYSIQNFLDNVFHGPVLLSHYKKYIACPLHDCVFTQLYHITSVKSRCFLHDCYPIRNDLKGSEACHSERSLGWYSINRKTALKKSLHKTGHGSLGNMVSLGSASSCSASCFSSLFHKTLSNLIKHSDSCFCPFYLRAFV